MKKKRALAGATGPPTHKHKPSAHNPVTPDSRRQGGPDRQKGRLGPSSKREAAAQGGGGRPAAPSLPWPALQRPLTGAWWPGPTDFEPSPDEEEAGEDPGSTPPPPPPPPQALTVAAPPDPRKPFPCLATLATGAGPPGGPTAGRAVLAALIAPVSVDTFLASVFEGRPLLVRGRGPTAAAAYADLFSSADLAAWVDTGALPYGSALDVVRYDGTVRHTLNYNVEDEGDAAVNACADPAVFVRRLGGEGCSARVLHPQRRSPALASVLCALEGFFGCLVGCNAYLTPPGGAQGFAPHADGVGVFILQAEGRKRWRLHGARCPGEVLPLASSPDFGPGEVGPLVLDTVLEAGDLLYLPRGMVHQAETPPATTTTTTPPTPSLHLTISVSDGLTGGGTWAELLATALPRALELAAGRCAGLRRALPPGVVGGALGVAVEDSAVRAAGLVASGKAAGAAARARPPPPYAARVAVRATAQATAARAIAAVMDAFPLDAAADAMAADFIRRRLPPPMPAGGGGGAPGRPLPPSVRPVAEGTAGRLVIEGDVAAVYHCMANDVAAHAAVDVRGGAGEEDRGRLALPLECAPAVEALLGLHSPTPSSPVVLADLIEELGGATEAVGMAAGEMWRAGLLY